MKSKLNCIFTLIKIKDVWSGGEESNQNLWESNRKQTGEHWLACH